MQFKDNANCAFDTLNCHWKVWKKGCKPFDQNGPGFWHVANVLHACLEYFCVVKPNRERTSKLTSMIQDSYALFNKYPDPACQGFWYDDYGWYGNAFSRAAQIKGLLSEHTTPTKVQAQALADSVWENYSNSFCNHPEWCAGCFSKPNLPSGRNTVTNALYLDFSMRLYLPRKQYI